MKLLIISILLQSAWTSKNLTDPGILISRSFCWFLLAGSSGTQHFRYNIYFLLNLPIICLPILPQIMSRRDSTKSGPRSPFKSVRHKISPRVHTTFLILKLKKNSNNYEKYIKLPQNRPAPPYVLKLKTSSGENLGSNSYENRDFVYGGLQTADV